MAWLANARMYGVTAEVRAAWRALFTWLADAAGVPFEVVEHPPPAPLETLWDRPDLAAVFMCGWPFAGRRAAIQPIAAPVPSPSRYGGRAVYRSDFVVAAGRPFARLEDTFGHRLAWTAPHSHSGFNAPRHHLLRYRTPARPSLFAATVGPLVTPRRAIDAVLDGTADVAPIDSLFLDLLRRHEPATADRLRVVGSTAEAPIPLLVASPGLDPLAARRLTEALCRADTDPAMEATLDTLLIARFVAVDPEDYGVLRQRAEEALAAGYPAPA